MMHRAVGPARSSLDSTNWRSDLEDDAPAEPRVKPLLREARIPLCDAHGGSRGTRRLRGNCLDLRGLGVAHSVRRDLARRTLNQDVSARIARQGAGETLRRLHEPFATTRGRERVLDYSRAVRHDAQDRAAERRCAARRELQRENEAEKCGFRRGSNHWSSRDPRGLRSHIYLANQMFESRGASGSWPREPSHSMPAPSRW